MEYGSLKDLITFIECGTNLHIGVLFFGNYGNEYLQMPFEKTIHSSVVCRKLKSLPNGYRRCYRCRNMALQKAIAEKKPFGGLCINGIYEYTRPVVMNDDIVCVIFIGNILPDDSQASRIKNHISTEKHLLKTMEKTCGYERCDAIGSVIEGYIKMSIELFPPSKAQDKLVAMIDNIKAYIEENLEYKIDLSVLADIFHYNEKYLGRLFKQKTGQSFSEYIIQRRVDRAKVMLKETTETVISISEKTGFNNVTYFNRMFKKHLNTTPTLYRQKYR